MITLTCGVVNLVYARWCTNMAVVVTSVQAIYCQESAWTISLLPFLFAAWSSRMVEWLPNLGSSSPLHSNRIVAKSYSRLHKFGASDSDSKLEVSQALLAPSRSTSRTISPGANSLDFWIYQYTKEWASSWMSLAASNKELLRDDSLKQAVTMTEDETREANYLAKVQHRRKLKAKLKEATKYDAPPSRFTCPYEVTLRILQIQIITTIPVLHKIYQQSALTPTVTTVKRQQQQTISSGNAQFTNQAELATFMTKAQHALPHLQQDVEETIHWILNRLIRARLNMWCDVLRTTGVPCFAITTSPVWEGHFFFRNFFFFFLFFFLYHGAEVSTKVFQSINQCIFFLFFPAVHCSSWWLWLLPSLWAL